MTNIQTKSKLSDIAKTLVKLESMSKEELIKYVNELTDFIVDFMRTTDKKVNDMVDKLETLANINGGVAQSNSTDTEQKFYIVAEYEPTERGTLRPSLFQIISEKNLKHFKFDINRVRLYELVSPNPIDDEEKQKLL